MNQYVFPTSAQLQEIDAIVFPTLTFADPIFRYFPIVNENDHVLMWEQQDHYTGLMAVRGLNGAPSRVQRTGAKRFTMEPGVYGDFSQVGEDEIVRRRQYGTFATPIDVSDLVRREQDRLRHRMVQRVRKVLWDLAVYGYFSVQSPDGRIIHQDAYPQRLFKSTVAWNQYTTATPLNDFRAVKLLGRGYGTSFGSGATAFMNQQTANWLVMNANAVDLYGRRTQGLATLNTLSDINTLFAGDGLPKIEVHDAYFMDETNPAGQSYTLFIPDGYVVVFGKRDAGMQKLGDFAMTKNANTTPIGTPGVYTIVTESERPPKTVTVDYGFNGGPRIYYPGSIVVMKVY